VLADQLKSLDWKIREFSYSGTCSEESLKAIVSRSVSLIKA